MGDPIFFSGTATDPDEGDLSASLTWNSDLDGDFETGASFSYAGLSLGLHQITASVTDGEGATDSANITVLVDASGAPPSVTILSPASGSVFRETDQIIFSGSADDPETGDVSGTLVWTSSKDGEIGLGPSFSASGLSRGKHKLTATATDPGGKPGSAELELRIRR
ncbi:MAG: Ig-like domain-containing protein [Myxococcota bacterium]